MSRRPPSAPPVLPGFEHVRLLGSGGFADVFLYQQQHPRRQVAVKVLLKEKLAASTTQGFTDEANLMAQLASHPAIVSVFEAGVAGDGRPYMVMEYCSRPNLQVRHRKERFSEAEALRVGIQIAGAVETAHRHGILHRDIKPANILVTEFGRPALTDFGISATADSTMAGMSIPWSAPEAFRMPPEGDASSDVYSLAATLFTLLTNRTPFEVPGASNSEIDVIARIQSAPVPTTGRSDVSPALEAVFAKAMAKAPSQRYASALEFGRALQRVQIELGMQTTQIDVVEDEIEYLEEDDDEGRTQFRGVTSIDAQPAPLAPTVAPPAFAAPDVSEATLLRPAPAPHPAPLPQVASTPVAAETVVREAPVAVEELPPAAPRRKGRRLVLWLSAAAVLVVAAGVAFAVAQGDADAGAPATTPSSAPVDPIGGAVTPSVEDLAGTIDGTHATFTWVNPDPLAGDTYLWRPVVPGESHTFEPTTETEASFEVSSASACIEVVLRRADGTSDDGVQECAP